MLQRGMLLLAVIAAGFAMPALAAEHGGRLDDCIHVRIDDLLANPGEDVMVPVHISDVTGWGVMAFEMEICWCDVPAGLIQFEGCDPGEVFLNSGWPMGGCGVCGPNCVNVAAAGATPLVGGGILFYLKFHVSANAKPCMCCDIRFTDVSLYDPESPLNVCAEDGKVCIEWCDVRGNVWAWYCRYDDCGNPELTRPLADVRVHLYRCQEDVATTYTDDAGRFAFECLPPIAPPGEKDVCPYCVDIDFCAVPRRMITAFDAALVLKHLVCSDDLTCCPIFQCGDWVYPQQVAADVNCTNVITAYDASLILQYVVGMIPGFPCPDMWVWYYMLCTNCEYTCPAGFGIVGVLKGDVSGFCYRDGPLGADALPEIALGVPRHFGDYVEVPVSVRNASGIYSAQFEVDYNKRDFAVIGVEAAGPAAGFMTAFNADGGRLLVAMASSSSFSGNGDIAVITLKKKHTPVPSASTRMQVASALLNETAPVIDNEPRRAEIVRFALGPVSPNPFTETAAITFSAPAAAAVSIGIYDVKGRLVRTLQNGPVSAGVHQAAWDGRDDSGAEVARGVYFCRMSAAGFNATEKVVLLQ